MAMRKLPLRLNQTQKSRYGRAMERLESLSSTANSDDIVVLSNSIPVNHEGPVSKGHGVSPDGELQAIFCGVVERVDKHVHVRPLRARYMPVYQDIVVGRVVEVADLHWTVDLNTPRYGVLTRKSGDPRDAVQSGKTYVNMRTILVEDDVVCAEVGKVYPNGSVDLKANISHKYGKLEKGQLLKVDAYLVKRTKHHIHYMESLGINLIMGRNGFIWVGELVQVRDPMIVDETPMVRCSTINTRREQSHIPLKTRQSICRTANVIRVLSNLGFTMTREVIEETVNLSITKNIDIHNMFDSEFHILVAENEVERRGAYTRKQSFTSWSPRTKLKEEVHTRESETSILIDYHIEASLCV